MRTTILACLSAISVVAFGPACAAGDRAGEPTSVLVFGAASLTNVVEDLGQAYELQFKVPVKSSFAASSVLAKQIEAGAPADVFLSADLEWMDYLQERNLLKPGSRQIVVGNRLVLIAPAQSKVSLKLARGADLIAALGADGKLATGDPDSVPVGKYAAAALQKLGLWDSISGRLVRAENVRAALAYVARSEAPLGIVYRTDALVERRVRIVDEFPADSHPPIEYPIALTRHAGPAAARFADFVRSKSAESIFRRYGFEPLH